MRLSLIFIFLTLVLVISGSKLAFCSSDTNFKPSNIDTKPENANTQLGSTLISSRKNTHKTLNFSLGTFAGTLVDQGENQSTSFLGLSQTLYNRDFSAQEIGIEITELGMIGIHLGWKEVLFLSNWNEPYYKISIAGLYKPAESFTSLINSDRYQIRASVGLEDFLGWKRKLRLELLSAYSLLGFSYQLSISYSIPD